jgi:hypothetical protein
VEVTCVEGQHDVVERLVRIDDGSQRYSTPGRSRCSPAGSWE